jgi:DNA phosphorothioation-associated putative methyltransferase
MIEAQEHLHMAAKSEVIAKLCNDTPFGVIDDQALYCHTALIPRLHPVLRIYVGCAELLHGDLADADLIKIHKRSGKLTLLYYNSFENRRLPVLQRRVKILLKGQRLQDFDHTTGEEQQILYNKELYVADDHPKRAAWSAWSQRLESIVGPIQGRGPSKERMGSILKEYGYDIQLRRPNAERAKSSVSDDEEM